MGTATRRAECRGKVEHPVMAMVMVMELAVVTEMGPEAAMGPEAETVRRAFLR
jgi:hypothetical protein